MEMLDWGKGIGLHFHNENEYYETIGYLTKNRPIKIYTHRNERTGAWGYQGKLERVVGQSGMPRPLKEAFNNSGDHRLSVSAYINNLMKNHNFDFDDPTNTAYTNHIYPRSYDDVLSTIPEKFKPDFIRGYNM